MLHNLRKYRLMPKEVSSERNQLVDDGTLSKILLYDIVRQLWRSTGLASVDANNCYNWVAHPMASMVFQSFGMPKPAIESILTTIQDMKSYLRTGYGDSTGYAGGSNDPSGVTRKTQGMCQGNGAAPAAWTVTSIPMIAAQQRKNHGAHFVAPISSKEGHLIGGLYVDNTDLFHLDMQVNENVHQAHTNLQDAIINWGKLLIATSGALKPIKCSYYLILFRWKPDGTWVYADNVGNDDFSIGFPLADGSLAGIEQLPVTTTVNTLGSMTCPAGSNKAGLDQMQCQGQE